MAAAPIGDKVLWNGKKFPMSVHPFVHPSVHPSVNLSVQLAGPEACLTESKAWMAGPEAQLEGPDAWLFGPEASPKALRPSWLA